MGDQQVEKLQSLLKALTDLEPLLLVRSQAILKAGNGAVHEMDFFSLSVLHRAISLLKAYLLLFENKNYLSAFSISRLQLDNAIRFFATLVVEDLDDFLDHFLAGNRIDKYKVRKNKLTDSFLAQEMDKLFPGSFKLYKHLSDYVHLSSIHFERTKSESDNKEALFRVNIGEFDNYTTQQKIDYTENMVSITNIITQLVGMWIKDKDIIFRGFSDPQSAV